MSAYAPGSNFSRHGGSVFSRREQDNPTLASTGRVLEAAKFGFGLGYMSSMAIIAAGQLLLGNPLLAAGAVATGVTLSNPMAMTCAAVGAIYYGWGALSDAERASILERLAVGLEMGIELLKSLIDFVVRKVKEGFSSKQLTEFKAFIKTQAAQFGTSLYDVTHAVGDLVRVPWSPPVTLPGRWSIWLPRRQRKASIWPVMLPTPCPTPHPVWHRHWWKRVGKRQKRSASSLALSQWIGETRSLLTPMCAFQARFGAKPVGGRSQ